MTIERIQAALEKQRELRSGANLGTLKAVASALYEQDGEQFTVMHGYDDEIIPSFESRATYIASVVCPITGTAKRTEDALAEAVKALDAIEAMSDDALAKQTASNAKNDIANILEGKNDTL